METIVLILIIAYLIIGACVASKEAEENIYDDFLDVIICGILGAFWPLTLMFNLIFND